MEAGVFTRSETSQQKLERDRIVQYDEHANVENYVSHPLSGRADSGLMLVALIEETQALPV